MTRPPRPTPVRLIASPLSVCQDLLGDLMSAKAHDFITPMMNAHLEFRPNCSVNVHRFHLLFVSRRSRHRQGCRCASQPASTGPALVIIKGKRH